MKRWRAALLGAMAASLALFLAGCAEKNPVLISSGRVEGLKETYAIDEIVDLSIVKAVAEYTDESEKIYPLTDEKVTVVPAGEYELGDTFAVGRYEFTVSFEGLDIRVGYDVTSITVTLDMNGGTFENKAIVNKGVKGHECDLGEIVPEREGKKFAGWFYDRSLTRRVRYAVDNIISVNEDTTLYAGYDRDWSEKYSYEIDAESGTVTLLAPLFRLGDFSFLFPAVENGVLTIPATVELYPVVRIAENFLGTYGFMFDAKVLKFEEGSSLKIIGDFAFQSCSFEELYFPETLEVIGEFAFAYNPVKGTLRLGKNLSRIERGAFSASSSLLEHVAADPGCALTYIGESAFAYNEKLLDFEFPEKLETIMPYAFLGCRSIRSLRLPASVGYIGLRAFDSMSKLTAIEVDENNAKFCAIDGVLYSKDKTSLIRYCFGKEETIFRMPSFVKEIHECAFSLMPEDSACALREIEMNEGLKFIGSNAFSDTDVSFTLPASLERLAVGAFNNWRGSSFAVSENNEKFAVRDGVLYSRDFTELYAVPAYAVIASYRLPDSVKTIKSGAFLSNRKLVSLTIGEKSALQEIEESGLPLFTMYNLKAAYIFRKEPFRVQNGAFYAPLSLTTLAPRLYVPDECYDAYAAAWNGYDSTESSTSPEFSLDAFLTCVGHELPEIAEKIESAGFTAFGKFEAGAEVYLRYSYQDKQIEMLEAADLLQGIYPLLSDSSARYYRYFTAFDKQFFPAVLNYLRKNGNDPAFCEQLYSYFQSLPGPLRIELRAYGEELADILGEQEERNQALQELIEEVKEFPLSKDNFDGAAFERLREKCLPYGGVNVMPYGDTLIRYAQLDASYLIWRLLHTPAFTADNRDELYISIYGSINSPEYEYSNIEYYLADLLVTEESKRNIYGLAEYPAKRDEFLAYCEEVLKELDEATENFDLTAPYDAARYNALFARIDELGALESLWYPSEKLYAIYASNDIAYLFENYGEISVDTYLAANGFCNQIDYWLGEAGAYAQQAENRVAYAAYKTRLNDFAEAKLEKTRALLDAFDYASPNAREQYGTILQEVEELGNFVYFLDAAAGDAYLDKWSCMVLWEKIDAFLTAYPQDVVTAANYADAEKLLYTYYDVESDSYILGIDHYEAEATPESVPGYEEYLAYKEWFDAFFAAEAESMNVF